MTAAELCASLAGDWTPEPISVEERIKEFISTSDALIPPVPGFAPSPPGTVHFRDREAGRKRLNDAWRTVRDAFECGVITIHARYSATYDLDDACLAERDEMTRDKFALYSQFDVATGGLRRQPQGSPDIIWPDRDEAFERAFASYGDDRRLADGYLMVQIEKLPAVSSLSRGRVLARSSRGGRQAMIRFLQKRMR